MKQWKYPYQKDVASEIAIIVPIRQLVNLWLKRRIGVLSINPLKNHNINKVAPTARPWNTWSRVVGYLSLTNSSPKVPVSETLSHVVPNFCLVVAIHRGRSIEQDSQKVFLDILYLCGIP